MTFLSRSVAVIHFSLPSDSKKACYAFELSKMVVIVGFSTPFLWKESTAIRITLATFLHIFLLLSILLMVSTP